MNLEPPPNDGVNLWVMSSARKCQIAGLSEGEAEQRILAFQGQTRRPIKYNEVKRAVEKAYKTTLAPNPNYTPQHKPKWEPPKTRQSRYRNVPKNLEPVDIWEASPDILDGGISQRMILDWLFPDPDGLVCVGKSAYEFHTAPIGKFKNLMETQFIVPCYMSKKEGITQDGKKSMHCLDNTGPRRYCVVDLDEPSSDQHPAIIWQIRKVFDLVMVLSSGGKGLHAWFNVPEDLEEDFWDSVIPLGADPALMRNRSSFVRMPMGLRDNGIRQGVLYFDHTKCQP
jgi:hypothetical protein